MHPNSAGKPTFMQDTDTIKSQLTNIGDSMQVIDQRDSKVYWISKLADGNIWMTQNLDLDLDSTKTYTPADTDVSANWTPINSTIIFSGTSVSGWGNSNKAPYSANPGSIFYYGSDGTGDDFQYTSLADCQAAHPDCSMRNHTGNYYNWSAAVATNNTSSATMQYENMATSICPAGWRLPTGRQSDSTSLEGNELGTILDTYSILGDYHDCGGTCFYHDYAEGGFGKIHTVPLWLSRSGFINSGSLDDAASQGFYWSSTVYSGSGAFGLHFNSNIVYPAYDHYKGDGFSVRCLVD